MVGVQIGLGCAHLEEALTLLEDAGFSPGMSKLASEIQEGLRELKPHCVLEHLKVCSLLVCICLTQTCSTDSLDNRCS